MATPDDILTLAFEQVIDRPDQPIVDDIEIAGRVEYVCRNIQNRAGARLLLACLLAKIHRPEVDVRKPYTEIGDGDAFSGRTYDERYVTAFVLQHELPCNPTTAFLTPALRNRNATLTLGTDLVGRPPQLYESVLQLLDDVYTQRVNATELLAETIRWLVIVRDERRQRIATLLSSLKSVQDGVPLSAEAIVRMIDQHLQQPRSSRLPVLVVAAAYQAASQYLGEQVLPLESHTAADRQTEALGDLEITLIDDGHVITSYEMKTRKVTRNDIDHALHKISETGKHVDNYIFITTDVIDDDVQRYAVSIYDDTNGIEFVILDCIGFLRHFLHLFHRLRMDFVETYQSLVLAESESGVNQPLKEVFLALRQAAESDE